MEGRNIDNGYVPLHEAAKHGNLEAVQELLSAQAPLLPRTTSGEFPFDLAKETGQTAVEEYLLNYKLPPATTSRDLWYHSTLKRDEAIDILKQFANQLQRKQIAAGEPVDTSGSFLVRYSESPAGTAATGYVLTLLSDQVVKNFRISQADLYQNGQKIHTGGVCYLFCANIFQKISNSFPILVEIFVYRRWSVLAQLGAFGSTLYAFFIRAAGKPEICCASATQARGAIFCNHTTCHTKTKGMYTKLATL